VSIRKRKITAAAQQPQFLYASILLDAHQYVCASEYNLSTEFNQNADRTKVQFKKFSNRNVKDKDKK